MEELKIYLVVGLAYTAFSLLVMEYDKPVKPFVMCLATVLVVLFWPLFLLAVVRNLTCKSTTKP